MLIETAWRCSEVEDVSGLMEMDVQPQIYHLSPLLGDEHWPICEHVSVMQPWFCLWFWTSVTLQSLGWKIQEVTFVLKLNTSTKDVLQRKKNKTCFFLSPLKDTKCIAEDLQEI